MLGCLLVHEPRSSPWRVRDGLASLTRCLSDRLLSKQYEIGMPQLTKNAISHLKSLPHVLEISRIMFA